MTAIGDKLVEAGFNRSAFEIKAIAKNYRQAGGSREAWIQAFDDAPAAQTRDTGHPLGVGNDQPNLAGVPHPMQSKGQSGFAGEGQCRDANALHPMPGGGPLYAAENSHRQHADARQPITSEADHSRAVQSDPVVSVPSAGEPIPSADHPTGVGNDHLTPADARNPTETPARAGSDITGGKASRDVPTRANQPLPPAREPSRADLDAMKEAGELTYFQMIKLRSRAWSIYRYKDLKNVRSLNMQENMIINDVIDWGRMNRKKDDDLVSLTMPAVEMKKIVRRAQNAIQTADLILTKPKRGVRRG